MLRRLKEEGITIIVSTPIMSEASLCDRIAFINHGEIQGVDTPQHILERFSDILCPTGLVREELHATDAPVIVVDKLCKMVGSFTAVEHI